VVVVEHPLMVVEALFNFCFRSAKGFLETQSRLATGLRLKLKSLNYSSYSGGGAGI
jgi:hypothetical protein